MNASNPVRLCVVLCAIVLFSSCLLQPGWAQKTTQSTGEIPLDGSKGNKTKKPEFALKGVTVKKTYTVDKKTGEVTQECTFKNSSKAQVDFIFCNMTALNSKFKPVKSENTCNLKYDKDAKPPKWSCVKGGGKISNDVPPSFHFGCTAVSLAPGKSQTSKASTADNTDHPAPKDFIGKEAKDFQVSYSDIFDLSGGASFDSDSCKKLKCFGGNTDTNREGTIVRNNGTGFWIIQKLAVTDPYVWWEELDGFIHPKEYGALEDGLSVPSNFPVSCPGLGRTSPNAEPPRFLVQDLNIWDMVTMSMPEDFEQPVVIDAFFPNTPSDAGVNIAIDKSGEVIDGGEEYFGKLSILRPERQVPEGTTVDLAFAFSDPAKPADQEMWEEDGNLVQDTFPPRAIAHSEQFDEQNQVLQVTVLAQDDTTSPTGANFWYSSDGGQTCSTAALTRTVNNTGDTKPLAAFVGTVNLGPPPRKPILFFYNVQDEVYNNVWLGIGTIQ